MKTLLVPQQGEIVPIAVDIFQGLWQAITGERLAIADEGEDPGGDLIVLGGDADNRFTHEQIMAHVIPSLDLPTGGRPIGCFQSPRRKAEPSSSWRGPDPGPCSTPSIISSS